MSQVFLIPPEHTHLHNPAPRPDFVNELINNAVEYQNWFNNDTERRVISLDLNVLDFDDPATVNTVPVGPVEYVHEWLNLMGISTPKPTNIPEALWPMCGREIAVGKPRVYPHLNFGKSADVIKGSKYFRHAEMPLDSELFLSARVDDILSEWRVFVHRGKIVGLHPYSGDEWLVPDKDYVEAVTTKLNETRELHTYTRLM